MADTEPPSTTAADGGPSDKEANKPDSPKPDTEVAPPLITTSKPVEKDADTKQPDKKKPAAAPAPARRGAGPASMVKKNVVMSSEAMKEMAKQAKANRDERKTLMDARHAFMFSSLAEALNMELSQVEDFLLGDDKFDMIEEFFAENGPRKLMFFYQETTSRETLYSRTDTSSVATQPAQKRLFLTTGTSEGLNGMCYFFLKSSNKAIVVSNIAAEVNFGMMDCSNGKILQGLKLMLSKVMMPALKLQENWGEIKDNGQVSDFMEQLEKFVGSLGTATSNMDGRVQLCEHEYLESMLDTLKTAADFQAAASVPDTVEKLEELSMMWLRQIVQVLTESEQMRKEADDIGPAAELDHWKKRMAKFNSLLDQIKSPRCKAVVGVLNAAKSKVLKQWKELDRRITDAANEAKDNVKYLYTLDKFFGPLVKCDPSAMIEHIPSLMNAIRMIHSISRYYNTSERMTSLFVKVTNQMITTCKAYINRDVSKIWDHERPELLKRLNDCIKLNDEYQRCFHRTKERLKETPEERQFEFSENYIFGKFDTFCRRLTRIADLTNTMESLSGLADVKIEGIDSLFIRFQGIVATHKKKNYDILDHRKGEFDQDYMDFRSQIDSLHSALQNFVDSWFDKPLTTEKALELLTKFEKISGTQLNLNEKYMRVLANYGRDLESVRKLYQKGKEDPATMRNIPPVAGKIVWARQLYRKIEQPMRAFKAKPDILKTNEAKKLIRNYNKMATVLLEYEVLYHRGWFRAVDGIRSGLQASLLVRHPETKQLFVNFDPQVLELIAEAKYMGKLGLEVPEAAGVLVLRETEIKDNYVGLLEMLNEYDRIIDTIPNILLPLMTPFRERVEDSLQPGLTSLNWTSLSLDQYISNTYKEIHFLQHLTKQVCDLLECRIDDVLKDMARTALCDLPMHEPTTTTDFLATTERACQEACDQLTRQSQAVESSVKDLVDMLVGNLRDSEKHNLQGAYPCLHPDSKHKRCLECLPCCYYTMLGSFSQRNTDALVKCTRLSLDTIKRRMQTGTNKYTRGATENEEAKVPLFHADIVLAIPAIVLQPSLDDVQSTVNKAVQVILKMAQNIPQWEQTILSQKAALKELEESKDDKDAEKVTLLAISQKPLHKVISEHKDVLKVVIALNNIVGNFKIECQDILNEFTHFSELWNEDPAEKVKEFMDTKPLMSEIESQMRYYQALEIKIEEIPANYRVGSVICMTERLKTALVAETKAWKVAFGRALNAKASADMEEIFDFIEDLQKRLSRPIKDLDDVRAAMAALNEIRESEIRIDMTITPIEESYALLHKYELTFADGNAEKVDSLSYNWKNVTSQYIVVQNHLLTIQPEFKGNLLSGVSSFQHDSSYFVGEYTEKGPMVQGIPPREASDRLQVFQSRFDELWAKFTTYSGGEELFGLPVTEYPDLQRIKKELNLLQKLYGLYNAVIENVNGYYDIPWVDVDIEKINGELQDFQNKCRKLPKALKEWQAFLDLKRKIDDFSECCPLLEMMANKAMMTRHWDRIANITTHTFEVESDSFLLRNIMTAPLLPNKEDIEDVCISAVKEKDIEAKLKQVVAEWSVQDFQFAGFKTRGELMLKGDSTGEIISMMEDSLMVLASLMSNRYNAPFKPDIQKWVQRLSNTTEIIENWMQVQNLWVYLEAVFVGGDIAKQLPQEAKRFSNIDKSWTKIMQRAHENTNVVGCCVGDDTLSQLLPHLLEQLEICQKSLTGYLEKKRLVFPRFFFVSDPALLEILGQASDSHTIQAHLEGLFDNVKTVDFHEKNYDQILAISSREKEKIELVTPVLAQGNVELWLGELLKNVRKSIHTVIRTSYIALQDKENFNLIEFENTYAAQVGLLGIQMIWTRDSEEALKNARADRKIMATTNQYFLDMLNMLIDMTTQELTKYERTKFETLVTIHVHQRDIFDDLVGLKGRRKD